MKDKWTRKRHQFFNHFINFIFYPLFKFKYNLKVDKLKDGGPYFILFNHQTLWDQFFILRSFSSKTYFVMSDDFDSMGFVSKAIRFTIKTIPYRKASSDMGAIRNIRRVIAEGGNVALAPEGNRTYTGETMYMSPTIAKLVKMLKVKVVLVNIHGFYALPRFAKKGRKNDIRVEIKRILEPEEFENMPREELFDCIKKELYVNDYTEPQKVTYKRRAEYLDRVIYYCPNCGVTHFVSKDDTITCSKCGDVYHVSDEYTFIEGNNNTIIDWDNYQRRMLLQSKLSDLADDYVITEDKVSYSKIIPHKNKKPIYRKCTLRMFKNRLEFYSKNDKMVVPFDDIKSSGCFGPNKVNLIFEEYSTQIKGDNHFNGLKYIYHVYKYKIEKGEDEDEFLGI